MILSKQSKVTVILLPHNYNTPSKVKVNFMRSKNERAVAGKNEGNRVNFMHNDDADYLHQPPSNYNNYV